MDLNTAIEEYFNKANNKIAEISSEAADMLERTGCRCDISEYTEKILDINSSMFILDKTWADADGIFAGKAYLPFLTKEDVEGRILSIIDRYTIRYDMNNAAVIVYPLFSFLFTVGTPSVVVINAYTKAESDARFYPLLSNPAGYVSIDEADNRYVRYDINSQGLNNTERGNARTNIQAVSLDTTETVSGNKTFSSGIQHPRSTWNDQSVRRDELPINYDELVTVSTSVPQNITVSPDTKAVIIGHSGILESNIQRISGEAGKLIRVYAHQGDVNIIPNAGNAGGAFGFALDAPIVIKNGKYKDFLNVFNSWRVSEEDVDLTGFQTNNVVEVIEIEFDQLPSEGSLLENIRDYINQNITINRTRDSSKLNIVVTGVPDLIDQPLGFSYELPLTLS